MHFANPEFLPCGLLAPLLVWFYIRQHKQPKGSIRYSDTGLVQQMPASPWIKLRHGLIGLRALLVLLLAVALARPQTIHSGEEVLTEGIDIMLVLDVSYSMRAEDFKPQYRLQVAKGVIADFVKGRKNDRIGLVVFAGKSFTQCPLTLDYGVLLRFLKQIDVSMIEDGTAIGMGIATGVSRLKDSAAKSKVMVLLTDGANNAGQIDPVTAADLAHTFGIKIYAIGVGKRGEALIPVDDPVFGRRYVRSPDVLDEEILTRVAEITKGAYFRATDPQTLQGIFNQIDALERTEIKTTQYFRYTELFDYLVWPALVGLLCEVVLANTRLRKIP